MLPVPAPAPVPVDWTRDTRVRSSVLGVLERDGMDEANAKWGDNDHQDRCKLQACWVWRRRRDAGQCLCSLRRAVRERYDHVRAGLAGRQQACQLPFIAQCRPSTRKVLHNTTGSAHSRFLLSGPKPAKHAPVVASGLEHSCRLRCSSRPGGFPILRLTSHITNNTIHACQPASQPGRSPVPALAFGINAFARPLESSAWTST